MTFSRFYPVDRIRLIVAQTAAGATGHEVWPTGESGALILSTKMFDVETSDDQTIEVPVEPPQQVNRVPIRTPAGQSQAAWQHVRILPDQVRFRLATKPNTADKRVKTGVMSRTASTLNRSHRRHVLAAA